MRHETAVVTEEARLQVHLLHPLTSPHHTPLPRPTPSPCHTPSPRHTLSPYQAEESLRSSLASDIEFKQAEIDRSI